MKSDYPRKRPCQEETNFADEFVFSSIGSPAKIQDAKDNASSRLSAHMKPDERKEKDIIFDELEKGQYFNFKNNVVGYMGEDLPLLYYDWLADSATTSHICNQCDAFSNYTTISDTHLIVGVGGIVQPVG
jgi:hypothetical protein